MLINSVRNVGLNKLNYNYYPINSNNISFKGKDDVFISTPEVVKGSISQDELNDILKTVKEGKNDKSGWTSEIFQLGDKIIKAPKDKNFKNVQEKQLAYGQNLKEYYALSKIQEIDPKIATIPYGVIKEKDKYYLVEELVKGNHPKGEKLTSTHIADLLTKFFKLDSNGITNCDLQSGNIFLTNDGKTKLIDFGSFNFIINDGRIVGSDYIPSDLFKTQVYQDTKSDSSLRFLKTFMHDESFDAKNLADNPHLKTLSNATNFEFRTLYSHLLDNSEENPLEFFKGYLKLKAENYHAKLKEFLETLSFDKIDTSEFPEEKINLAKLDLNNAISYEDLIKKALQNPDNDIVKVELSKLQLRTFLNLGDSLKSPIENSKKLYCAYNQLISTLEDGIKNSDGDKKEYFIQTLNSVKARFGSCEFAKEQVEIPDSENLIKVLFNKTKNQVRPDYDQIREGGNEFPKEAKGIDKKTALFIALGVAVIAGIIGFIVKKNKKTPDISSIQPKLNTDNISNITPKTDNHSNTTILNNNYLSKKLPNVFAKFKK